MLGFTPSLSSINPVYWIQTDCLKYIQKHLPAGYHIQMLDVKDPQAMHIDATILPLQDGLLVYNPMKITEAKLRRHAVLAS